MIAGIIIGAIVLILVIIYVANYNGLVGLRNQTKNAWAQIDVQLKRRQGTSARVASPHKTQQLPYVKNLKNSSIVLR